VLYLLEICNISDVPSVPGVYLMYEGKYVVYVGVSGNIKNRLIQHLVRRDSSITTSASAVSLNPSYINEIRWWENEAFSDRNALEAAELIAFDIFCPVIRSRGATRKGSIELYNNKEFRETIEMIFKREASGSLKVQNFDSALKRIEVLEKKVSELENIILNNLLSEVK
jgi:hypothetical protein